MTGRRKLALATTAALLPPALALAAVAFVQPRSVVRWFADRDPNVLYFVDTEEKVVALTIDDGPHPETTPEILEVLAAHGARATFFVLGNRAQDHEPLLRAIVQGGHELGNHMMGQMPSVLLPRETFREELTTCHEILAKLQPPRLYRPGSGWYHASIVEDAKIAGYRVCLASIYPHDTKLRSASLIARYLRWRVHPGGIIVLHEGSSRRRWTIGALEAILPWLREQGYEVVTVTELLERGT